ncbi:enoyl-CoA hydratase [Constrictibacter sp. MBR-5]|uniref:enoyl-CoA hydratase n=1 Tax=Constrictibacter sp. MBR-5 TaxID=3156467 RepID=UPI00339A4407
MPDSSMSDSSSPVAVSIEERPNGKVATVAIDNARRMNSLGSATMRAFIDAVDTLGRDPDLRLVIVTGVGDRAFMGGADIFELGSLDQHSARDFILLVHGMSRALRDLPVPVIARVNGICLGAGLEVMAACDMRVASDNAVFGMPEVKIGLPSVVEAALLPQLIGWGRTKVFLYTGENIDAREALEWGLVERVVPAAELDAAVARWVDSIVAAGPNAIRLQKGLMREWEAMPVNDAIQAGVRCIARSYETDEPRRLIAETIAHLKARKRP